MKPARPKTELPPSTQLRKGVFRCALRCAWAAVSLLSSGLVASASFYSFTKIADSFGDFAGLDQRPRLNAAGTVAFYGLLDSGVGGVFTGSGGAVTPVALDTGPLTMISGFNTKAPGINDLGMVSFLAYFDSSPTVPVIFKGSGGPVTTVYDPLTATTLGGLFGNGVTINNVETVAFYSVLSGSPANDGIFSGTGGTTYTTIATHTGATFNAPFSPNPRINNGSVVAFRANLDGGGSAVAKGAGGTATLVANTAAPEFSGFFGDPDINEAGQVVFMAARDSGGSGIFLGDGTAAPLDFATTDDGFTGFSGDVAINDHGAVIFHAHYASSGSIFNGPDPVSNKIVGPGTKLEPGVFASGLAMINGSLNNDRSFVFHANLSGGGQGIYRGDLMAGNHPPVPVTISNRTVHAGSLVSLTATATDPDVPADILTFTLDPGAPATAEINPTNGVFTWTPGSESIGSTNAITVRVTDNGVPALSATTTFQIAVVSPPVFQSITVAGADLTLTWSAITDSTYRVQYKVNLDDLTWTDLPGDVTATAASASKLDTIAGDAQRFYQILFVP